MWSDVVGVVSFFLMEELLAEVASTFLRCITASQAVSAECPENYFQRLLAFWQCGDAASRLNRSLFRNPSSPISDLFRFRRTRWGASVVWDLCTGHQNRTTLQDVSCRCCRLGGTIAYLFGLVQQVPRLTQQHDFHPRGLGALFSCVVSGEARS
jgi:hypothetical protein